MKTFAILTLFIFSTALAFPAAKEQKDEQNREKINLDELLALNKLASKVTESKQDAEVQQFILDMIKRAVEEPVAPVDPAQPPQDGDVSNVLTDIVNTITEVNGLNSLDVNDKEIVTNLIGLGNIEVVAGSSGTTTKIRIGDIVTTIGAIQGQWYNFDVANVNVDVQDN